MLSLGEFIIEQAGHLADQVDKSPSQQRLLNLESEARQQTAKSSIDFLASQLEAADLPRVLWSLSQVVKLSQNDLPFMPLVPGVLKLLNHSSTHIEYAALSCCTQLCQSHGLSVAPIILPAIIQRLRVRPAIEYVNCLQALLPFISTRDLRSVILALVTELLSLSETHHYAAAELFLSLGKSNLQISQDDITPLLNSAIVFNRYLPTIADLGVSQFGKQCLESTFARQLLAQAKMVPGLREGACRAIPTLVRNSDGPQVHQVVMAAFGWAAGNETMSLALVEMADTLAGYKNGAFQGKSRDLGIKLAQSPSVAIRARLIGIYADNPATFLSSEAYVGRSLKALTEDSEKDVRKSFVSNFHACYSRSTSCELKDRLFSWLLPYFGASDPEIGEALSQNRQIFQVIGSAKLAAVLPQFLRIVQSLGRWRVVATAIAIMTELPVELIRQASAQICATVHAQLIRFPVPLKPAAMAFYSVIAAQIDPTEFASMLVKTFRLSPCHRLRSFFIEMTKVAYPLVPSNSFLEFLWPNLVSLVEDPVPSVKVCFVDSLRTFRQVMPGCPFSKNWHYCLVHLATLAEDPDPYVRAIWEAVGRWLSAVELATDALQSPSTPDVVQKYPKPPPLVVPSLIVTPVSVSGRKKPVLPFRPMRLVKTLPDERPKSRCPSLDSGARLPMISSKPRARIL
jgi:hypothetical protein